MNEEPGPMDAGAGDSGRRETDVAAGGESRDSAAALRARMVERQLSARGIRDPDVLAAMRAVPRHLFVPEELRHAAYDDSPLPIGFGQTISQPYMVACMTEALRVNVRSRVLDVGAGSGYQTAVLAELAGEVFAIERVAVLEEQARERLARMGYDNAVVTLGDGSLGWPEHAPYDGIMVAAATTEAPPPLLDQLAEGGRLVVPLGEAHRDQVLTIYERHGHDFVVERGLRCRFVPLVGDHAAADAGRAGEGPGDDDPEDPGRWEEVEP